MNDNVDFDKGAPKGAQAKATEQAYTAQEQRDPGSYQYYGRQPGTQQVGPQPSQQYGYYPYWPYYYAPQPQQPVPQKQSKKPKFAFIFGLVAAMILCVFLGAFLSVYVIYPLYSQNNSALPSKSPAPSESTATKTSEPKVDQYPPDQSVASIGGIAPVITDAANPVPEIAAALSDSVVGVNAKLDVNGELTIYSRGTGFVIHPDGYIITNYHVVSAGTAYTVTTEDGTEYDALYVGGDASTDIVVLKVNTPGLKAVAFADSSTTRVGELAIAMGNPAGAGENLVGSVTVGYVSAVNRELVFNGITQSFIQTDAALNPGNSGGPLVNSKGEVVGIVTLKSLVSSVDVSGAEISAEGIGFAIPINTAAKTALSIINGGSIKRPGIGIQFQSLTAEQATKENVPVGKRIYGFLQGSPAKIAGMQVGDIVTKCNGQEIGESSILVDTIANSKIGDKVILTVWRNGKEIDYTVVIGDINQMSPQTEE